MRRIGIIGAMADEVAGLKELMQDIEITRKASMEFYAGTLEGKNVVVVQSGIGKVNAARATQILIDNMEVEYIFNIGVAGSVSNNVKIGDIVLGEKLVQHDFDLTAFEHEKGYIPNLGIYIPSDLYLLKLAEETKINTNLHKGIIASGDIFCTENKMSEKIAHKFNALCVEMEGASIAQVCYLSHIPFLVIRSISDSPNEDTNNKISYDKFLENSSKIVASFLLEILNKLK